MIPMDFDWLANVLATQSPSDNKTIKNINTDTRTLCDGEVFLALQGPNFDGHKFVEQAKNKGAIGVIVHRKVDVDIPQFLVTDTRLALGQIGAAVMANVAPKTIAITGSVGKTTVAVNLAAGLAMRTSYTNPPSNSKVLLIDMDTQCNASMIAAGGIFGNGEEVASSNCTLSDVLLETASIRDDGVIVTSEFPTVRPGNLDYIPSVPGKMEILQGTLQSPRNIDRDYRLKSNVKDVVGEQYAYIVIDTPPSTDTLVVNAMMAGTHVLIPLEMAPLSLGGLADEKELVDRMARLNSDLKILGILPSRYARNRAQQREIYEHLLEEEGDLMLPPISNRASTSA